MGLIDRVKYVGHRVYHERKKNYLVLTEKFNYFGLIKIVDQFQS